MNHEHNHNRKSSTRAAKRAAAAAIAVLALVALALLALFSGRGVSSGTLSGIVIAGSANGSDAEPYTYETGSQQAFARAGDGFAVASTSSLQLVNSAGVMVGKEICSFATPAVSASSDYAIFFDIGGTGCVKMGFDGSKTAIEPAGTIISACMSASGYYTVITERSGYKGLVSVYNPKGELVYEWYSGEGYAIKADVSPDGKHLAVLCITETGSVVHTFALTSTAEKAKIRYEGKLLFELKFMNSSTVCSLGENGIYFTSIDGAKTSAQTFDYWYLCDYCIHSGDVAVLYLSRYRTGADGKLFTVDSSGKVLGSLPMENGVLSLSANGKNILVMTGSSLELYSSDLSLKKQHEHLITAKRAFLRRDESVLLMSSYYADVFVFE